MTLTDLIARLCAIVQSRIAGDATHEEMLWAAKEAVRQWLALN